MEQSKRSKLKVAMILNAFVLPGTGHFYAGYKLRGVILSLSCAFFIIIPMITYAVAFSTTLSVVNLRGQTPISLFIDTLSTIWPAMSNIVTYSIIGILVVWFFSLIDIYQKMKKLPKEEQHGVQS